jgi:hypothetical protein
MTPIGVELYNTEESVFQQATAHLSLRFRLAYTAPCYSSQLLNDIGHLRDTQCTQEILNGTYTFPPDTDRWTRMILEEAHHTYTILTNEKSATTITVRNFQTYWWKVNEKTSSSFSWLHFGHYKAASHSSLLSSLHAAKLTACARMGVPLTRWSIGLMVLLKKTHENNFIHKMRAICLLEADFNYFNKTIFARWMTASAKIKAKSQLNVMLRRAATVSTRSLQR